MLICFCLWSLMIVDRQTAIVIIGNLGIYLAPQQKLCDGILPFWNFDAELNSAHEHRSP